MKLIKRMPISISALILAILSLGNLLQSYGNIYRNILGFIGVGLLVVFILKLILFRDEVREDLKNPVIASVFPTFSMAIMIFSSYLKYFNHQLAGIVWSFGLVVHLVLLLIFTDRYVKYFKLEHVYPSWFIVFVGMASASVTSLTVDKQIIGKYALYFSGGSYIILLILVIKRFIDFKEVPEPVRPTFAIMAAPASLCLAGYLNSFIIKEINLVYLLLAVSQITYFIVLFKLPELLKIDFYPSFSAFTFPLVITALSLKLSNAFLIGRGIDLAVINYLVKFEELVALSMVAYVSWKYIEYMFILEEKKA